MRNFMLILSDCWLLCHRQQHAPGMHGTKEQKEQDITDAISNNSQAGEVNVYSSFGVPFGEVEGKLLLDTDSLRQQIDIVVKANPKLSVVGW